ncbi:unnamed protein product [Mytilus edulis]|uniref:Uncharacterized protein n=1 Tax=Mytilus edulis TaxID=6550 RepID=A0A8S3TMF5_MYTED|nr:unnamed protein product [Mytilus edulis]
MVGDDGECLVLEEIGHGKSGVELWVKFNGAKFGRNLLLKNLSPKSEFLPRITSVTELIDKIMIKCPWVEVRKRKRKQTDKSEKETNTKNARVVIDTPVDSIEFDMSTLSPQPMKDNYLGMFEVNVLTLMPPPEKYLVRKMNHDWVSLLRQKIMLQPNVISTIFPVMINPVQVKERSDFLAEKLSAYQLWTLGGNHLRAAMQNMAKDVYLNEIRNVQIHLYCGLTEGEAMTISNLHNGSQTSLKPTFQDNVYQALKMKDSTDLSADVAQMLGEIEMKEIAKESVGTVVSVARYGQENIKLFNLLVKKFQQKNGTFKSIPQALFKELQGIKDLKRTSFLQEALDTSLKDSTTKVKTAKKKKKLEECMLNITKSKTMDQCREIYPDHCDGIDRFLDLDITKNCIPSSFVSYCQEAVDTADLDNTIPEDFSPDINININLNGTNISNNTIVNNIINHIKKHTLKKLLSKKKYILESIVDKNDICDSDNNDICDSDNNDICDSDNHDNTADDSGFPDTSEMNISTFDSEIDLNSICTESNAETQQPETSSIVSQDLFVD